jgi:hypothetical protein
MEELLFRRRDLGKRVRDKKKKYPSLFSDAGMNLNFEDKILLGGENLNPRKLKKYNKW